MNRKGTAIVRAGIYALCALVAASSCANIKYRKPLDPVLVLKPGSTVYVKADRPVLEAAVNELLEPSDAAALAEIVKRTTRVTAAAFPDPADPSKLGAEAVLEGKYPSGVASAALSADKAWTREGKAFAHREKGVRVAFADGKVVAVATAPVDALTGRMAEPGSDPVPPRLRARWDWHAALFVPDAELLVGKLMAEDGEDAEPIPLECFLLSAVAGADGYSCEFVFSFENERAAKVYSPPCKLAVYALVDPVAPGALSEAVFSYLETELVVSGITLSPEALARAAASLIFR